MISQAYIFGALGKAAIKQQGQWFLMDADEPKEVRKWHLFDSNFFALTNPETIHLEGERKINEVRNLLELESKKHEALALSLQFMDTKISGVELKNAIASLLEKHIRHSKIYSFVETRLLSTVVPASFNPAAALKTCEVGHFEKATNLYRHLAASQNGIQQFFTVWQKVGKKHFKSYEDYDTAYARMTESGLVKELVMAISQKDKIQWDVAAVKTTELLKQYNLLEDTILVSDLKQELETIFKICFENKVFISVENQKNVFIDCPYDEEYLPLLKAVIFTVKACGFQPKIILEHFASVEDRTKKINQLIEESQYCIHDLSKIGATKFGKNQDLRLSGKLIEEIAFHEYYSRIKSQKKNILVLGKDRSSIGVELLSNLADAFRIHGGNQEEIIKCIRDWFYQSGAKRIKPASTIWVEFNEFMTTLSEKKEGKELPLATVKRISPKLKQFGPMTGKPNSLLSWSEAIGDTQKNKIVIKNEGKRIPSQSPIASKYQRLSMNRSISKRVEFLTAVYHYSEFKEQSKGENIFSPQNTSPKINIWNMKH